MLHIDCLGLFSWPTFLSAKKSLFTVALSLGTLGGRTANSELYNRRTANEFATKRTLCEAIYGASNNYAPPIIQSELKVKASMKLGSQHDAAIKVSDEYD